MTRYVTVRRSCSQTQLQRLNRLRKKSSSTAALGCASMLSAAKPAQARVPVLLKAAWNRLFPQTVKPTERNICSAGLKSPCDNLCAKRFCSVGLQADTVDSSTCPPERGRYIDQNQVLTKTPKPGHPRRPENCAYAAAKLRKSSIEGENNAATRD